MLLLVLLLLLLLLVLLLLLLLLQQHGGQHRHIGDCWGLCSAADAEAAAADAGGVFAAAAIYSAAASDCLLLLLLHSFLLQVCFMLTEEGAKDDSIALIGSLFFLYLRSETPQTLNPIQDHSLPNHLGFRV